MRTILRGLIQAGVLLAAAMSLAAQTTDDLRLGTTPAVVSEATDPGAGPAFAVGAGLGYQRGLGFQVFGSVAEFADGFPLALKLRAGYTRVAPGSAPEARRIFINNATNGTPTKSGSTLDFGLDGSYPLGGEGSVASLYGGVRYSSFKGNFKYVGGNEDFDVTSSHWGMAAGLEAHYPMTQRADLLLAGGAEYYFSSRLTGHDTSYAPNGDDVNPREDFGFSDADEAIDQPTWRPVLLLGVRYRLGR